MTHPIYSTANLEVLTINRLKEIASQLGIKPATDARLKKSWVMAIINHQARLVESLPHINLLADRVADRVADTIQPLEEEEEEDMVPLPIQPLLPILAIVMMILALSIAIVPLALLITIPLVFRRSSSSTVRIPKI